MRLRYYLVLSLIVSAATLSACGGASSPSPDARTVADTLALGRPVVLAHAGGNNTHPHSTPYAFAEAVKNGADILDMDVQLSKDGVLVVHHDDSLDRTTNITGKVADLTYEELRALDNAYWFIPSCWSCQDRPETDYTLRGVRTGDVEPPKGYGPDDFIIPRFIDIAKKYKNYVLNIEIKGEYPAAVPAAKQLAKELIEADAVDRAVVTSFNDDVVAAFHEIAPDVEVTPGLDLSTKWVLARTKLPEGMRILQLPPNYQGITVVTKKLVDDSRAAGYVLWVWPDENSWENADGYAELLDFGVGGINAADPRVAVQSITE